MQSFCSMFCCIKSNPIAGDSQAVGTWNEVFFTYNPHGYKGCLLAFCWRRLRSNGRFVLNMRLLETKRFYLLFFLGVTLVYLSLSPGAILGMGYTGENVNSSNQIIAILGDWVTLTPTPHRVTWPRHGLFELLFEIPFLLFARLFFAVSPQWADRILSAQPVIVTSLLCTVIFIWVRRITSSLTWSYVLAMVAAFSTMLWPYAYIGLETTQSLFVLLSGYFALGSMHNRTWRHVVLFALSCGLAISLKSNSIFLVPAVAFLCFAYVRSKSADDSAEKMAWQKTAAMVAIIVALYGLNAYTRSLSPIWASGTLDVFKTVSVGNLSTVLFNTLSLFGSANKGLLVYCPVVLICLLGLGKAYRKNARVAVFAGLALGGLIIGSSLFYFYTDETWGPRYLHAAVAPLIISLAVARESMKFRLRREIPLIALAAFGAMVSFLGAFYYYGTMHAAATRAGQSTIENLQSDPNWNHIRFNLMLCQAWARGADAAPWTPARHWWYEQPPDAPPLKTINLKDYSAPQSSLVRGWSLPKEGYYLIIWYLYLTCLFAGTFLLAWLGYLVWRSDVRPEHIESRSELMNAKLAEK